MVRPPPMVRRGADTADERAVRVLVATDHADPSAAPLEMIRRRAERSAARFRVVVPNPARGEPHPLHPERVDRAAEAEGVLLRSLPLLERADGGHVVGSVSVRHDPTDAVEEILFDEPVDEILVDVAGHGLTRRLHLDLAHRLRHLGPPVSGPSPPG